MKLIPFVFLVICLFGSCSQSRSNLKNNSIVIENLLNEQKEKWNSGDLEGFMGYYWNNDSLCFLSKNGMNCGWTTIYNNYKKGYDTPEKMGELEFKILKSKPLSERAHFLAGRWIVMRTQDTIGGSFNLLWELKDGRWVIVFDHTS